MTTGRINQVTIVRRGWPTARISGRKSCLATGRRSARRGSERTGAAPTAGSPALPGLAAEGIHLPPLDFPERRRRVRERPLERRVPPKRPKRRPRPGGSAVLSVPSGRVSPDALLVGLANCQSPTEPIRRRYG